MMLLKKKKRRRNLPMTVSLDDEIVEEGELEEAREFGNDVFESILDQETTEEEEEEDDDNYGLMDQDMSEYLETRTYYAPSPVMDIDDDPVIDEEQEVCAICLAEYKDEGTIALLQCCHEFHVECINKWLQRKKTCPFCRAPVKPTSHD
ncbi:putative BTB/POZ domain-containing protein-like [Capsicum annuum]|nr:putative BTB/POZ domain-containing protein-like [Capsicum annuum]